MNAEEIFHEALARPPAERPAFLAEACAGDEPLQRRVEALLHAHENPVSLLAQPPAMATVSFDASHIERPGAVIGPYKLLERIGEGGMGAVWMAEQTEPIQRRVALKVIKEGMDSKQVLARFEAERQALALMEHPNIAKVLDAGKTPSGRPYFVMELVKGKPITTYCDEKRLAVRERLELFGDVCRAVQHAHQKGIIHRDIKPSNVLVAPYDGKPVVKVIDFGVAKATGQRLTDRTLFTGFGALVGTPEYMSPEQAEVNNQDIDTRSDVYSLGVLLYELLTGSTPVTRKRIKEAALLEVLRVIREEEPPRPSTRLSESKDSLPSISVQRQTEPAKLTKLVRGELDWIVMKSLEKDRNRRYETANGFAMDVQRYLADEPVQACPPSAWYRLRKFARKNRRTLVTVGAFVMLLAALGGGVGWMLNDRAARQREADTKVREAESRVEEALATAAPLLREGNPRNPALLSAAQRVQAQLDSSVIGPEVRRRAEQLLRDVRMLAELDDIRLRQAESTDGSMFDLAGTQRRYAAAFSAYGIDVTALEPSEAAARIGQSAIREAVVAGLDAWMVLPLVHPDFRQAVENTDTARLQAVADAADDSAWRRDFRAAALAKDAPRLKALAGQAEALTQPPGVAAGLGSILAHAGLWAESEAILRQAQARYPADFWLNYELGWDLIFCPPPLHPDEAVGCFRAAVAIRPGSAEAWSILGIALLCKNDTDGAIAALRQAIALDARFAIAHANLGDALRGKGDEEGAIAEFGKAIALHPVEWYVHHNLARALADRGKFAEAEAEYGTAIALKPDQGDARTELAVVLERRGKLAEAEAELRKAITLQPDNVIAHGQLVRVLERRGKPEEAAAEYGKTDALQGDHADNAGALYRQAVNACAVSHYNLACLLGGLEKPEEAAAEFRTAITFKPDFMDAQFKLGLMLASVGRFADAVAALKRGCELGARDPRWPEANTWHSVIQDLQRSAMLEALAPVFLRGEAQPADPRVGLVLAHICQFNKHRYAAAAHFYEEAFVADPWLENEQRVLAHNQSRYRAACAAALAGCGGGEDAPAAEVDRARLRRRALEWLQAELAAQQLLLEKHVSPPLIQREVGVWTWNSDFAGVRDQEALAKLPEAERHDWERLWRSVRGLAVEAAVAPIRAAPAPP